MAGHWAQKRWMAASPKRWMAASTSGERVKPGRTLGSKLWTERLCIQKALHPEGFGSGTNECRRAGAVWPERVSTGSAQGFRQWGWDTVMSTERALAPSEV